MIVRNWRSREKSLGGDNWKFETHQSHQRWAWKCGKLWRRLFKWEMRCVKISLYVVLNKAFSIASKNTKFTINVVPVTAKSADRTLLDFDVFGESEQTGAMTSKSDDHSLAWRNKNQIVSSLHLNPGVRCRRQHQLLKTQVEFLTGLWLRTWLVNVFVTCWETSAQHDGLRNQLESKKCTVRTLKVRVRTARTVRTS